LQKIVDSGINVVFSSQSIGDFATQFFAKNGIFSAGRVDCLENIVKAFGGQIASNTEYMKCGNAELFEEKQIGEKRYNVIHCGKSHVNTLIMRGPGNLVLDEVERSIHDA